MNIENKHKENYQRIFLEDTDLFFALQDELITFDEYTDRNIINAAIEELLANKCSKELDLVMQYQSE